MSAHPEPPLAALADLVVRFGANVQPGQVVSVSCEPGKEPLMRAVVEAAYRAGAKYVDVGWFDMHVKRLRALHAPEDTLGWVPPWLGERMLALGEMNAATIALTGPVAPHVMDDVDPARVGRDMLPRVKESAEVLSRQALNWTVAPAPTAGWAELVHPEMEPEAALAQLWEEIAHILRLDEPDPIAAWIERMEKLEQVTRTLDELALDAVRLEGPGTDLTIGLFGSSHWIAARMANRSGVVHAANLPTEEVFTSPDPTRVDGTVRATKPLFTAGALITGIEVRFEGGRAVEITADTNADTLRTLAARDDGAARLGELALVDRESRIGRLGTVFYDTLLDENAASHIALGQGFQFAVADPSDQEQLNRSEIHIDFMIGSDAVDVTGLQRDGTEVPLLRDGAWQI